ncbi:TPA: hypothetical protein DCL30_05135 [Candidatus Peribacteria bacterium]|nr:MAG: hypothetical protein A2529_01035 [Candidatus Peribacteria bacterium RIFOXYD2_FULL_58_15]HAI98882.1 hypothetical protein [Candidatus Peribacteria bacterium]HAS33720.1 hypothetical protein [Candidatus Peribacteria bacterium]
MEDQDRIRIEEDLEPPSGDSREEVALWNAVRAALRGTLATRPADAALLKEAMAVLTTRGIEKVRKVFRERLRSVVPVLGYIRFNLGEASLSAQEAARTLGKELGRALGMEVVGSH